MDKQIKDTFEAFNPTKEQKEKMLRNINSVAFDKKTFDYKKIYIPAISAVAAVFVFVLGFGTLKNINNITNQNNITGANNTVNKTNEKELTLLINEMPDELSNNSISSKMVPETIAPISENHYEQTDTKNTSETISFEKYSNIIRTLNLPQDMENYTNEDAYNDILFLGTDARCISMNINYDTQAFNKYFDGTYKITNIKNNNSVVFFDENYTVYTQKADTVITTKTVDITEKELINLLESFNF